MEHALKRKDKADAVLIIVLLATVLIALCLGFAVDITKSIYFKDMVRSNTQTATAEAVRKLDTTGSLNYESVQEFADRYMRNRQSNDFAKYSAHCPTVNTTAISYQTGGVTHYLPRTQPTPFAIITASKQGRGVGANHPDDVQYFMFQDDSGHTKLQHVPGTANFTDDYVTVNGHTTKRKGAKPYTVLRVKVFDNSFNFLLGMFSDELRCQQVNVEHAAVKFSSQTDVNGKGE